MQKLLLEFSNLDEARLVKRDFEKELPFEVFNSAQKEETNQVLDKRSIQLIIAQSRDFQQPEADRILELRSLGYTYPILYIVDRSSSLSERFSSEEARVVFIEKPFELRTLRGLARKLMTARAVSKQQFRRFPTNQTVYLENFASGENIETSMFNLSKGGAYFEVDKKPGLGVGELLRLKFHLDQVDKEHQIHGRVIWTTPKGHSSGGYGIGVKFIKQEDIYRHLLQSV